MSLKLDRFLADAEPRTFEAGQVIFREYDMGAEMYVVLEGEVELSIDSKVLETLGAGQPFGEMALIDSSPRTATATAKTAVKLAPVPEKRFLFLVQQEPEFALRIMKTMTDRLRKMNQRL